MRRCLCTLAVILAAGAAMAQDLNLFTLGAGDVAGSYYASASAICDVVNREEAGILRCSPDPTSGSIYNLSALESGELDFAFAQSDWHRDRYAGEGLYAAAGPMVDLRSVMSLYGEALTILVRADSGIAGIADLKDHRVDLGPPSSGRRGTVDRVLSAFGFVAADFRSISELPSGAGLDALCEGTIDATLLVLGHPNKNVARVISDCGAKLLPLTAAQQETLIAASPDMQPTSIPKDSYSGLLADVPTVEVIATIVTKASTDAAVVEKLVRATLMNLPLLARKAPVLAALDPEAMRKVGLSAPLHPGAKAAYDAILGPKP
ncbi:MAG: TAXI family TRAP transporter solute-binding subunit [Alphaproteobacteria bacterium]